jgi:hypothetical protein
VAGSARDITQHGNNSPDVFFVGDNRRVCLKFLKKRTGKYALELIGYRLVLLPCFWPKAKNHEALGTESSQNLEETR